MTPLRIAVVSTPRAGNTWVRHLLGTAYAVPHLAVHCVDDWSALPPEVVLQIHWRPDPAFVALLQQHGFRVVTIARHPLDVLISILHFCVFESESDQWLLGEGGNEASIYAAMPRSRPFIEYARGPRAGALLGVTPEWWDRPGVVGVRYEDCVADADAELRRIEAVFGPVRCGSRSAAIEACSLGEMRRRADNNHFWKGSPGLWRRLLPAAEATEIAAGLTWLPGYACDPDPDLSPTQADRNWIDLVGGEVKSTLRRRRDELSAKDVRMAELQSHIDDLTRRLKESIVLSGPVARWLKRQRPAASGKVTPE